MVHRKSTKLLIPWLCRVPKHCKHNAIVRDLHRFESISMNFADQAKHIKTKFCKHAYPLHFADAEDSFIVPTTLFD